MSLHSGASSPQSVVMLDQKAVAVPLTGTTTETALATITIPAGRLGANGQVVVEALFSCTNNANNKTARIKFAGTQVNGQVITTSASYQTRTRIANRNAANSQVCTTSTAVYGNFGASVLTLTIDTTANVDITLTGQLAVGTDTITLESYQVILSPKA